MVAVEADAEAVNNGEGDEERQVGTDVTAGPVLHPAAVCALVGCDEPVWSEEFDFCTSCLCC